MDSKFSILPTVRDHYDTLVDAHTGERRTADYLVLLGLPAAVGVGVSVWMWRSHLLMAEIGSYLAGVAIFTALLFGLVIHVFQLRMQLDADDRVSRESDLIKLVNELFKNVNYAVVAGGGTTILAMIAAMGAVDGKVNPIWAGVLSCAGLHLVLAVMMCIKRIRKAYNEIGKLPTRHTTY